jgi:arsenate reductase
MIRQSGVEPTVVEYLKNPPSRERIIQLVAAAGITLRQAIRQKDTPYEALGLGDTSLTDDAVLDAIADHPILLNRPFVETPIGTRLCRPSEVVLDILENASIGPFTKEDGEVIIDAEGKRIV